ncbi:MAG: endonuclease/exonuclease/phosphatase family protein [Bacteroidales bacterium]|nr:endonuclease/exonuclease/phosphatase family protein [Bacteroidales bacterium]
MKKKPLKMALIISLCVLLSIAIYFAVVIIYALASDYKPDLELDLKVENIQASPELKPDSSEFSILIWNIGYAGLGEQEDFFYDGGTKTRPKKSDYLSYRKGISDLLEKQNKADFILIQEVDVYSRRTFYDNQLDVLSNVLKDYNYSFAKNYDVKYVPLPLLNPMGKVNAGMATFSKFKPYKVKRIGFDVNFVWWKRIFMLDRCFIASHYKIGDKELVVMNLHNSAFDDDNILKPVELQRVKEYATEAYKNGCYVILGGDWNQNPPKFTPNNYSQEWNVIAFDEEMPSGLMDENWQWVYGKEIPTQRFLNEPFLKGKTATSLLDYFLVSPNIEVLELKILPDNFKHSDHMPVLMRFKAKKGESRKKWTGNRVTKCLTEDSAFR